MICRRYQGWLFCARTRQDAGNLRAGQGVESYRETGADRVSNEQPLRQVHRIEGAHPWKALDPSAGERHWNSVHKRYFGRMR